MERTNINDFLLSLGWKYHGYFVRDLYYIGNIYVFVYDGNKIGYYDKEAGAYVYCNMNDDELQQLTDIAVKMNELETHPSEHTISEYMAVMTDIMNFISKLNNKQNEQ